MNCPAYFSKANKGLSTKVLCDKYCHFFAVAIRRRCKLCLDFDAADLRHL